MGGALGGDKHCPGNCWLIRWGHEAVWGGLGEADGENNMELLKVLNREKTD